MTNKTDSQKPPRSSDVIAGLIVFLSINLLVAAMYFKIINP
ncbi:MAG: photosystem I protein PsaX [Cyanobacteriota bacterium]|nr:photosystem I protein PsaX [Cyanobacteriota bacterium]